MAMQHNTDDDADVAAGAKFPGGLLGSELLIQERSQTAEGNR